MNLPENTVIYDAHTHIFPDKIAERASRSIGDFYDYPMHAPAMAVKLLEEGRRIGTKKFLVCSSAVTPSQVESINHFISEMIVRYEPFIGLAAMHPGYDRIGYELDLAKERGLIGVKFHPDFQKFALDDDSAIPMYKELIKRDMIALFHMGDDRYDYSSPKRLARLLRMLPDLKVHAAHFGGYRCWEEAKILDKGNPNLFFDTSSSLAFLRKEEALELLEHFGYEKFVFGTDFPMWDSRGELKRFLSLGLSESENRAILGENFERFYVKKEK